MTGNRPTNIPIFDLKRQNESIMEEVMTTIKDVISSGKFILSEKVKGFEQIMADRFNTQAIGVASGTDALYLSLKALDISEGDEVITTPFTFISPVEMIIKSGARPVFVDIDPHTYNINPDLIPEKITPKTKAILPVHLFGLSADMEKINNIAQEHELLIIEDAAQSFGARISDQECGTFGDVGCFSFFPTKILSCYGDGGMAVSRNPEIAHKIRALRAHGSKKKYCHDQIGINSRLDEIQAAVLLVKIKYLDQWIGKRREIAKYYNECLEKYPIQLPVEPESYFHVYHQFTIRTKERDKLYNHLKEKGIGTIIYYPAPLHTQPACRYLRYKAGDFPETERACQEVLSLPIFPELTSQEVGQISSSFSSFFQ